MPRKKKKEEEVEEGVEESTEVTLSAEGSDLPEEEPPVSEEEAIDYAKGVAAFLSEAQEKRKEQLRVALGDLKGLRAKLIGEYCELRGADDVCAKVDHMISLAEQELAPLEA